MITIQDVVKRLQDGGRTQVEIGSMLGVSYSMVSRYKTDFLPSLAVACKWYVETKEVLHPYAEQSLIKEITDENNARANTTMGKR